MKYAIIKEPEVDFDTKRAARMALAAARKELKLPDVRIKFFTLLAYAKSSVETFEHEENILGLFRPDEPDTVYVMATQMEDAVKNAVYHECVHLAHWLKGKGWGSIDGAEKLAEESVGYMRQLNALDRAREEDAFNDYLSGKDSGWASPENQKAMRRCLGLPEPNAAPPVKPPVERTGGDLSEKRKTAYGKIL